MHRLPAFVSAPCRRLLPVVPFVMSVMMLPAQASSQAPPVERESDATAIFNALLSFRLFWLGDSTTVEACRAVTALGNPEDFPSEINPRLRRLLDQDVTNCKTQTRQGRASHAVVLDSAVIDGANAEVFLTLWHGEYFHHQHYFLLQKRWGPRTYWYVTQVVLSGSGQALPGR